LSISQVSVKTRSQFLESSARGGEKAEEVMKHSVVNNLIWISNRDTQSH